MAWIDSLIVASFRRFRYLLLTCRLHQPTASATAHLATLATGGTSFVRGPLVRRALFMRRTPALAGDLALLLR